MEIKTTKDLWEHYPHICYAGVESSSMDDINACDILKTKKWISLEDLKQLVNEYKSLDRIGLELSKMLIREELT